MSSLALQVSELRKSFGGESTGLRKQTMLTAVSDVSFEIPTSTTFALVGETGSGKTTVGRIVAGLETADSGSVLINGEALVGKGRKARLRASRHVHMVHQDPNSSLDPRARVGAIVAEPLLIHGLARRSAAVQRVGDLLALVGLKPADAERYPHEFSGGQRQRIAIARGLALGPELLVLDEPVSALDLSVRAQVTNLLLSLQEELGTTYLMISHDLLGMRHMADMVAVLYRGHLVELGPAQRVFDAPQHPYTQRLISSIPHSRLRVPTRQPTMAAQTEGGCVFLEQCPRAQPLCATVAPEISDTGGVHHVAACHFPGGDSDE